MAPDLDTSKFPPLKDLSADNITQNVHLVNSQCSDARLRFVFDRLVAHVHDFARETRLSTPEWRAAIDFLTATGQMCSDLRQEFILLSDVLGLSLLVDAIDHPKPDESTAGTLLGPFHTHDAPALANGDSIIADPLGEPMLALCSVKDTAGKPVAGVKIDLWQGDSQGYYDVQHSDRTEANGRAVIYSDEEGKFWFKDVVPVSYPVPVDGPVGKLLLKLGRHPYRPAHTHFMFEKEGYDHLITALYVRGDKYENSDVVFGVKESLLTDIGTVSAEQAKKYGVKEGTKLLSWDFVLVSDSETKDLRHKQAKEALKQVGHEKVMTVVNGLPVYDVD